MRHVGALTKEAAVKPADRCGSWLACSCNHHILRRMLAGFKGDINRCCRRLTLYAFSCDDCNMRSALGCTSAICSIINWPCTGRCSH